MKQLGSICFWVKYHAGKERSSTDRAPGVLTSCFFFFLTHLNVQCICSPHSVSKEFSPIISLHHRCFSLLWFSSLHFSLFSLFLVNSFLPSFLSTQLPLWFPTAPLLSGCQIKVKIFFRVLSSAFLLFVFLFFFSFTHHLQTIEFSSWA